MIIDKQKGEIHINGFDDLMSGLIHYDETIKGGKSKRNMSQTFCPYSWSKTMDMLKHGWPEGVQQAFNIKEKIEPIAEQSIMNLQYDVTGHFLDIGRFVTGEPECFGSIVFEKGPTKNITVMVHSGALGSSSANSMMIRGGAVMATIEALQKKYFVDVILCNRAVDVGHGHELSIFLKLNTMNGYSRDLLAFYVVNPAFHRRITFALRELYLNESTSRMGATVEIKSEHRKGENVLYFESIEKNRNAWLTTDTAKTKAIEILKEFNNSMEKN